MSAAWAAANLRTTATCSTRAARCQSSAASNAVMLLDWSRRRLRISAATLVSCWSRVATAGDYAMRGEGTIVRRRRAVENSPAAHRFPVATRPYRILPVPIPQKSHLNRLIGSQAYANRLIKRPFWRFHPGFGDRDCNDPSNVKTMKPYLE
jgi:hypothetical protein